MALGSDEGKGEPLGTTEGISDGCSGWIGQGIPRDVGFLRSNGDSRPGERSSWLLRCHRRRNHCGALPAPARRGQYPGNPASLSLHRTRPGTCSLRRGPRGRNRRGEGGQGTSERGAKGLGCRCIRASTHRLLPGRTGGGRGEGCDSGRGEVDAHAGGRRVQCEIGLLRRAWNRKIRGADDLAGTLPRESHGPLGPLRPPRYRPIQRPPPVCDSARAQVLEGNRSFNR